jgi:hypothetical protein
MGKGSRKAPSLRLHRPSGRAVVTLGGRDFYVGEYGTDEAKRAYETLISQWHSNNGVVPDTSGDLTVNEILEGVRSMALASSTKVIPTSYQYL